MSARFALACFVVCILAFVARAEDVSRKSNTMVVFKNKDMTSAPKPGSPAADGVEVFKVAGKHAPIIVRIWAQIAKVISKIPNIVRKMIMGVIWALLNIPVNIFGILKTGVKTFMKLGMKAALKALGKSVKTAAVGMVKDQVKDHVKDAVKDKAMEAATGAALVEVGVAVYGGEYYFDGVREYNINAYDFRRSAIHSEESARFKGLFGKIGNALKKVGGAIKKGVEKAGAAIKKGISAAGAALKKFGAAVMKAFNKMFEAIKKFVMKAINKVVGAFKQFMDKLGPVMELGNKVLNFIDNFVSISTADWKYMGDIKNYGLEPVKGALPTMKADQKELDTMMTSFDTDTKKAKAKFVAKYPVTSHVEEILYE